MYDHDPPETPDDERLRLIFTCCHPALAIQVRVAVEVTQGRWSEECVADPTTCAAIRAGQGAAADEVRAGVSVRAVHRRYRVRVRG